MKSTLTSLSSFYLQYYLNIPYTYLTTYKNSDELGTPQLVSFYKCRGLSTTYRID